MVLAHVVLGDSMEQLVRNNVLHDLLGQAICYKQICLNIYVKLHNYLFKLLFMKYTFILGNRFISNIVLDSLKFQKLLELQGRSRKL